MQLLLWSRPVHAMLQGVTWHTIVTMDLQIAEELASLEAIYGEDCMVKPEERSVEVKPTGWRD